MAVSEGQHGVIKLTQTKTSEIRTFFKENGYYFPVDVISPEHAEDCSTKLLEQLKAFESTTPDRAPGNKGQFNPHVLFKFAYDIAVKQHMLDAVGALIGPDIMIWASTLFIKEPHSDRIIPWHQDLRYIELERINYVTGWVALSPVTRFNGCMRLLPRSQKLGPVESINPVAEENFHFRTQHGGIEIDESKAVHVEMLPGQASFHHGYILHTSGANESNQKRIGFAINYIAPHNRQAAAIQNLAMLVLGEDRYGYFEQVHPLWET